MIRRVDPRRPALVTPQGLRRIVLGGTEGTRDLRRVAHGAPAERRPRLSQAATACLLVMTQADNGGLDEHARETVAAAALLARADEAVVVVVHTADPSLQIDAAALGIDRLELLPVPTATLPDDVARALGQRWQDLRPRLLLLPERGADADLGRRFAVALGLSVATTVVEISEGRARVRDHGEAGRAAGDASAALAELDLLLLARQVARAELSFLGLGACLTLPEPGTQPIEGLRDLGRLATQSQQVALEEAEFVVAAGNGVTDVALFHELAAALGAAVGASRVAVDDGRFLRSQQIGATGKTVQARGYLALGISGAVQHLQGIRDCRHVIAVNTDPAAPIAQRSELTVAEDVQALMRELLRLVRSDAPHTTTLTEPAR